MKHTDEGESGTQEGRSQLYRALEPCKQTESNEKSRESCKKGDEVGSQGDQGKSMETSEKAELFKYEERVVWTGLEADSGSILDVELARLAVGLGMA